MIWESISNNNIATHIKLNFLALYFSALFMEQFTVKRKTSLVLHSQTAFFLCHWVGFSEHYSVLVLATGVSTVWPLIGVKGQERLLDR